MTHANVASPALAPLQRLANALADPARRERTVLWLLAAYVACWTLYGVIAKGGQDIHADMAELVGWSRELALGYVKHPPFAAWIVAGWFAVFPVAEWSYYLLAMVVVAVALWLTWRLSADYLDGDKRVVALALLTLIPFFNFHALKFNMNTVLLPLWPATTLSFLRSFEKRSAIWATLAGIAAAASMLGKYWSIFLLLGLGLAALLDSRRRSYFCSAAPWITIAVGVLLLAPHIVWLVTNDFAPIGYAVARNGAASWASGATSGLTYLGGAVAYVALAVALALFAARPDRAAVADTLLPASPHRRLVAVAFWAPLLLPAFVAMLTGLQIVSLWTMSAWTLLGIVLLSSPEVTLVPARTNVILALACVFPFVMLAAAPAIAIAIHHFRVPREAAHSSLLVEPVEQTWREATDRPLRIVGGDLAFGIAFYLPGSPSAFPALNRAWAPWIDDARLAREGIAIVCASENSECLRSADNLAAKAPAGSRRAVTLARRYLGGEGPSAHYWIIAVPPAR